MSHFRIRLEWSRFIELGAGMRNLSVYVEEHCIEIKGSPCLVDIVVAMFSYQRRSEDLLHLKTSNLYVLCSINRL